MRIDVWGALRVAHNGRVLGPRDFAGAKPKQLLEILIVERGHTVSKSRLADLLWGGGLPPKYQATLETYISVLRQTLEPGVRACDSVVLTERGGYRLDAERTTLDLEEFDLAVASAAGRAPGAALAALNAALVLVRGPVLEDEPDAVWGEQLRSTCSQKHLQVLVDAGRLSLRTGNTQAARGLAEQAVALDPLAEAAYRVLMTAAYLLGRQGDALQAFDRCRRELADELGVDPMAETVALHLAILRHEEIQGAVAQPVVVVQGTAAPRRLEAALAQALEGRFALLLQVLDQSGIDRGHLTDALLAGTGGVIGSDRRTLVGPAVGPVTRATADLRQVIRTTANAPADVLSRLIGRGNTSRPVCRPALPVMMPLPAMSGGCGAERVSAVQIPAQATRRPAGVGPRKRTGRPGS